MKPLIQRCGLLLVTVTLVVIAGVAWGATSKQVRTTPRHKLARTTAAKHVVTKKAARPMAGEAGMRIFADPQTGEIGPPTTENMSQIARPDDDFSGLTIVRRADGSKHIDLQGRFQESMIIQLDKNGHKVMNCVPNAQVAKALKMAPVAAPAPATTTPREDR